MMFLFRFIHPHIDRNKIIIVLLLIIVLYNYQMIASLLLNIVGGKIVFLDYILSRASQNTTYELSVLSFYQVLILFVLVIAITVLNLKKILWNEGLYKFYNIFAFLSVFIWLFLPYFIIPFSKNIPLAMLKGIIVMVWIIFFIYVNTNAYYIYKAAPYLLSYSIFNYL